MNNDDVHQRALPVRIELPEDSRAAITQLQQDIQKLLAKFDKLDIARPRASRDLLVRSVDEYLILCGIREKKRAQIQSRASEALRQTTS